MAAESQSMRSMTSASASASAQSARAIRADGQLLADAGDDVERLSPSSSQPPPGPGEADLYKPRSVRFWLTLLCNFLALFLVALDRTIIATAVPRISDEFQALGDIGWYGSSYMLTTACAQLLFGRIYKFYDMKWSFLLSIVVFEVGSAICGAAPNSTAFIVGRAIAGLGSAGIFSGCLLIMIPMVPLHRRPAFQGLFGMVFGIASVLGPLIGGGFTGGVTWRWCFYINLPIGAVALLFMILYWNPPKQEHAPASVFGHAKRLDPLGMLFFMPGVVCLFVAFQWGGSTHAWDEWRVVLLLAVFAACTAAFVAVQILKPDTASVPPRVITQRSVAFGTGFTFFLAGSMLMLVYYVPVWFQTVKQVDPMKSGIYTLPLVLSLVVSSIASGAITQKIGYYVPSMLAAPVIMSVGEGLLSTLDHDSPAAHWASYQFLSGFGLGFGMQTSGLAIQTVLPREDISTGIAINFFVQQLGGAVFTSVGQTILTNMLVAQLSGLPGFDPELIVHEGATKLTHLVPAEDAGLVIGAYNRACRTIFLAAMGLAFASLLCALGMEWRSIKKGKHKAGPGGASAGRPRPESPPPPSPPPPHAEPALPEKNPAGPIPGKPFFERVVKNRHKKPRSLRDSLRDSFARPRSTGEEQRGDGGRQSSTGPLEKGQKKQSVLTKAAPHGRGSARSPTSSSVAGPWQGAGPGAHDQIDDDALAGALRDWARYSMVHLGEKEKAADVGREENGGATREGRGAGEARAL